MYLSSYDPKNQPLFHFKGYPVRLALLLVVIHTAALIIEAVAGNPAYEFLALRAGSDWPSWWQWGTYVFCHFPSVWFLIDMWFLWRFGSELEGLFGRRMFAILYAALILIPPAVGALGLATGMTGSFAFSGTRYAHFCLFLGCVFIHPQATFAGGIRSWHLGVAFFGIFLLQEISMRNGVGTAALCVNSLATYFIMRKAGLTPRFERVREAFSAALPRPKSKKLRALAYEPKVVPRLEVSPDRPPVAKINAILEKIGRSGLESLDDWERRELERASEELKRQDG